MAGVRARAPRIRFKSFEVSAKKTVSFRPKDTVFWSERYSLLGVKHTVFRTERYSLLDGKIVSFKRSARAKAKRNLSEFPTGLKNYLISTKKSLPQNTVVVDFVGENLCISTK